MFERRHAWFLLWVLGLLAVVMTAARFIAAGWACDDWESARWAGAALLAVVVIEVAARRMKRC